MKQIYLFLLIGLLCVGHRLTAQEFVHPGLLHSSSSLQRIHGLVERKAQPSYGSYLILKKTPEASAGYQLRGPYHTISRAGRYGYTKDPCERDFNAAYYNALMWIATREEAHAAKAMEIIRAYADTLQDIEGPDDPLCAGLQGFILVNAAEVMRYTYTDKSNPKGWNTEDSRKVEAMFRNVFLPVLTTFYQTPPYTNGNWGIAVTKAQQAFGVFLNDRKLYNEALDFFLRGKDNGSLPNYVAETGQLQESGRDQQHCMLGIGSLAEIAEVAWTQGEDLYGTLNNRIMKGYEYLAKSNLGYDVPFKTWKDITGKYSNWQSLGKDGMQRFRSVFEIGYNHYAERQKQEMPYTRMVLGRIRPEGPGFTCDNPGFGTLLFYLGADEVSTEVGCLDENLLTAPAGWNFAAASFQPVAGVMSMVSSGVKIEKKGIYILSSEFPYIAVKVPQLPEKGEKNWLQFSFSIMSAPEFWKFDVTKAKRIGEDIYVFKLTDTLSNNGTRFPEKARGTVILDFGETNGNPVSVEWLRSCRTVEDIK